MFTKEHYEVIADAIKRCNTVPELKEHLIRVFQNDNTSFKEDRFRRACIIGKH